MSESTTGVILPDNGTIDVAWAKEQLGRVDLFSQELLNYGKGEIFFTLETNQSQLVFDASIKELGYTVETAKKYISYLQKKVILESIKDIYYVALSLSAAEVIPDAKEDALALCSVCVAKYGKLTVDNLIKAAADTGMGIKKMSDSARSIDALKKEALKTWLKETFRMTEESILNAGSINVQGKQEFLEGALNAYDRLEDWTTFYKIVADIVFASENKHAIRFLADMQDISGSIEEFIESEKAYRLLMQRVEKFEEEVYPKIQRKAIEKQSSKG